jgi:Leucine Rich repeat
MVSRPRRSRRTTERSGIDEGSALGPIDGLPDGQVEEELQPDEPPPQNVLPDVVRHRQRAVAEREASRLARPDPSKSTHRLSHADRKKSAVTSTPSGVASLTSTEKHDGNEEWCGPWSVARQMIAKREEAKRRREELENDENANGENHPLDDAMEELAMEQKRKAHPSMQWKSSLSLERSNRANKESLYGKRQKRMDVMQHGKKVPSLFDLCVAFLADNVDSIESLGIDTDADIRTAVMDRLIADQLLNDEALNVLAEVGIDTLQVSDGSNISELCLSKRLEILIPAGLTSLTLDQCGRCFSTQAVQSIIKCTSVDVKEKKLHNVMIGGGYNLQDADIAQLIKCVTPPSLGFKACNLLGKLTCQSISDVYSMSPSSSSLIDLFLEDIPLTSDDLNMMISKPDAWKSLKKLSLRRINGLDDGFLHRLFGLCCHTLAYLDVTDNIELTDSILASLRYHNVADQLQTLILQGLKNLTAIGLEAFFMSTPMETDSLPPRPMMLQVLNLGQCSHDAVTDELIRLVTGGAPILNLESTVGTETSDACVHHISKIHQPQGSGGLISLNVQGSSLLTDFAMEHLASNKTPTYRTLKELNISFCPSITDQGVGFLVDNCQPQLRTIKVWGNAQLTDNLFDGHQRIHDPSFEVVGVWMKKASSRTIR